MAQRSHVPKFGNWDGDNNVPYTAYFENARKEKSNGLIINPNDPDQNPDAFNFGPRADESRHTNGPATRRFAHQKKSPTKKTMESGSSSDRSKSDHSLKPKHQRRRSDRSQCSSESYNILPSPGPYTDDFSCRSVSVPRFGEWDEKDPRSAEGFTTIFEKVKEEKHIAASKFTPVPAHTINNYHKKESKSKKFCCGLF